MIEKSGNRTKSELGQSQNITELQSRIFALRHTREFRIAALGDSSVFGVGDTAADGNSDGPGWVGRLAHDLGAKDFINLSKNGSRAHTVVSDQMVAATFFRPNLICICVGMNDVMRGNFSPLQISQSLCQLIGEFNRIGSVVVILGLPDPSRTALAPQRIKRILASRVQILNEILSSTAANEGALFISAWERSEVYERKFWHVDRMHPSSIGHQLIADLIRNALHLPNRSEGTLPVESARSKSDDIKWLLLNGSKWLIKRSVDLIPTLIYLLIFESNAKRVNQD